MLQLPSSEAFRENLKPLQVRVEIQPNFLQTCGELKFFILYLDGVGLCG